MVGACDSEKADKSENNQKTIEQAMLDSQIDTANIFYTEEIEGQDAFSIYKSTKGMGVIQYQKKDDGWQYTGSSEFGYPPAGPQDPVTFGASTWPTGNYSLKGPNSYNTVFLGEILEPEIDKVIIEVNHGKYNANTLISNDRTFWYVLYEKKKPLSPVTKISGYSSDGELLYENYISKPQ